MRGLLDAWNGMGDDTKGALVQGLLAGGFGALAGRGTTMQAIGQGGLAGLLGYNNAINQQQERAQQAQAAKLRDMQMQESQMRLGEMQRDQQTQEQIRGAAQASVIPAQLDNASDAGPVIPTPGGFDQKAFLDRVSQIDPLKAWELRQSISKTAAPIKVGAGETLFDPATGRAVFTNPKEQELPGAVREYQYAQQQGYKGSFQQFQTEMKRAGATSVNVNTEKPLLNTLAGGLGKQIDDGLSTARGAVSAIGTAHRLMEAVDSGKLVAGPGASFRVLGLQLGQMMGVGGRDAAEVLANTRSAIQSMAQAELDAAQQMKGQGQITESERDIIRRAASGNIDALTGPEIRQLAAVMEKTARFKIASHRNNLTGLRSMPGAETLLPFYNVDEPPPYRGQQPQQSGSQAPRVRRYNPQTGGFD